MLTAPRLLRAPVTAIGLPRYGFWTGTSYEELLQTCRELQQSASRAISVKQQLIETREALEQELDRYQHIQRYADRALPLSELAAFAALTTEVAVEIFNLEAALCLLLPEGGSDGAGLVPSRVIGAFGLSDCPATLPLDPAWIASRQPVLLRGDAALLQQDSWRALGLASAITCPLHDADGRVQGALMVLRTQEGALFYPELPGALHGSLGILAQQAGSLLRNLQAKQLIQRQVDELREAMEKRRQEQERRHAEEQRVLLQQQLITAQAATLRQLATPIIPIREGTIAIPLIGSFTRERAYDLIETTLDSVARLRARAVLIDITGVPDLNAEVAGLLLQMTQAVRLLGAEILLSGIRAEVAQRIIASGIDLCDLRTTSSFQSAIRWLLSSGTADRLARK